MTKVSEGRRRRVIRQRITRGDVTKKVAGSDVRKMFEKRMRDGEIRPSAQRPTELKLRNFPRGVKGVEDFTRMVDRALCLLDGTEESALPKTVKHVGDFHGLVLMVNEKHDIGTYASEEGLVEEKLVHLDQKYSDQFKKLFNEYDE